MGSVCKVCINCTRVGYAVVYEMYTDTETIIGTKTVHNTGQIVNFILINTN